MRSGLILTLVAFHSPDTTLTSRGVCCEDGAGLAEQVSVGFSFVHARKYNHVMQIKSFRSCFTAPDAVIIFIKGRNGGDVGDVS